VRAPLRLGFHRDQTKDQQWLFTNRRCASVPRGHVQDVLLGFAAACGVPVDAPRWDLPVPDEARAFADRVLPADRPVLTISPCANARRRNWRNWTAAGYAAVADHAAERHGMAVVLSGGRTEAEARYRDEILARTRCEPIDLVGGSSLKELLAVLERSTALVCPDSGPAHLGSALGVPVIGLYATTNPDRARPYRSARWVVNRYPDAVRRAFGCAVEDVPFGRRVRDPSAMELITVEDVTSRLDELVATLAAAPAPSPARPR
jgi:heptosyltransferase I